jgi:hypothetical protein
MIMYQGGVNHTHLPTWISSYLDYNDVKACPIVLLCTTYSPRTNFTISVEIEVLQFTTQLPATEHHPTK